MIHGVIETSFDISIADFLPNCFLKTSDIRTLLLYWKNILVKKVIASERIWYLNYNEKMLKKNYLVINSCMKQWKHWEEVQENTVIKKKYICVTQQVIITMDYMKLKRKSSNQNIASQSISNGRSLVWYVESSIWRLTETKLALISTCWVKYFISIDGPVRKAKERWRLEVSMLPSYHHSLNIWLSVIDCWGRSDHSSWDCGGRGCPTK